MNTVGSLPSLSEAKPLDASAPEFMKTSASEGQIEASADGAPRKKTILPGVKKTPGPGEYVWHEDVHKQKLPVWSMSGTERKHLDMMVATWVPAQTSNQHRAPDPCHYGDLRHSGPRGKFFSPKWSWERTTGHDCLQKTAVNDLETDFYNVPKTLGGHHPAKKMAPNWSVYGAERKHLPYDKPTWTPERGNDTKPGPANYNPKGRKGWKVTTRLGCTFGARPLNLPNNIAAWVSTTHSERFRGYS